MMNGLHQLQQTPLGGQVRPASGRLLRPPTPAKHDQRTARSTLTDESIGLTAPKHHFVHDIGMPARIKIKYKTT
jgi:hypothetical protein